MHLSCQGSGSQGNAGDSDPALPSGSLSAETNDHSPVQGEGEEAGKRSALVSAWRKEGGRYHPGRQETGVRAGKMTNLVLDTLWLSSVDLWAGEYLALGEWEVYSVGEVWAVGMSKSS